LLLQDRLYTRKLLRRKKFQLQSHQCATIQCNSEETLVYLFWTSLFAEQFWNFVCPQKNRRLSVLEAFEDMRTKIKLPFAMEILVLAAWGIWIVKNNKVFKDQKCKFQ
jgi:hypothetical protein